MNIEALTLFVLLIVVILVYELKSHDDYIDLSISKGYYINNIINSQSSEIRPRKYVYLDLGANTGDSLYNFLGIQEKAGGGGELSSLVELGFRFL